MTRRTLVEGKADVLDRLRLGSPMTFRAGEPDVRAHERELRLGMIESCHSLPCILRVASAAVFPQLAAVDIFVTRQAVPRQAEERPVQVLHLDGGPLRLRDVLRRVTLLARQFGVPALQRITCPLMVEGALGRLPVDQTEILAVVLGVAPHAGLFGFLKPHHASMKSTSLRNAAVDFLVALSTPEDGRSGKQAVAGKTVQGPGDVAVGSGKRPRRDLSPHRRVPCYDHNYQDKDEARQ